jgi:hypothetical protein
MDHGFLRSVLATACACAVGAIGAVSYGQSAACAPGTAGGVVVTTGRGGTHARLAASASGLVVAWAEQRPFTDRDFAGSGSASWFFARSLDRDAAPREAPVELFSQSMPSHLGMGPALATTADGRIAAVVCTCAGGAALASCQATALVGAPALGALRPMARAASVCPMGPLAATGIGSELLVGAPFPDADGIRMYGTAVGALQDLALEGEIDAPAMAALGADQAVYARRAGGRIEARRFDVRGNARGAAVVLSTAGAQVGAPFLLGAGERVFAAFSQRRGRRPWTVHLTTWRPGSAPTHADVATGAASAMAPSLAPSTGGCMILSWTEGTGRATVARAGRVCEGALDAGSVATLSRPGIEAGDSELASDGTHVYAVWQELPTGVGARPELRTARLGCR